MPRTKNITTINLSDDAHKYAQREISNLSAFIEDAIEKHKAEAKGIFRVRRVCKKHGTMDKMQVLCPICNQFTSTEVLK